MKQRDEELGELRRRLATLTDEARKNEEAWKRSQRREMALLDAADLPALLTQLTEGLRISYRLQSTSVMLVDRDHEIRNLLSHQGAQPRDPEDVVFVAGTGDLVRRLLARKRPWLGPFAANEHGRLFAADQGIRSVALVPLLRPSGIIGSLHFGSRDALRFTSAHATDFLSRLGLMAAFGLENTVNRARLVRRGFTDVLTGWHNRDYLQTRLHEELARCQREQTTLVCLMLDIDHFKRINDEHGHAVGDVVLREVAERIGTEVRGSDVSARYGGEEFIVLLPHTHLPAGLLLAERIRALVAGEPFGRDALARPLPVTVSIGLAEYRPDPAGETVDAAGERLIAAADAALYDAKAAGRNAVMVAQSAKGKRAPRRA